ncbi:hypothetical protein CYR55_20715 [Chimaeribacter californicus]|uniref:Uncharacterized protein n=1 Tax=Chimaeribacter californicus TaxID=2060067 RepID=A0A2N5DWB5_9GAMM|nr:hypothetical protein [Chimaeribacter californicus]PLR31486.1 hypothetical protein CYR55_20715 [Chimaeribacter californicus]
MSEITSLTVKIPSELKEKLRAEAEEKSLSLSQLTAALLDEALSSTAPGAADVDSTGFQDDEEETIEDSTQADSASAEPPLSAKELRGLRKLLRKKK